MTDLFLQQRNVTGDPSRRIGIFGTRRMGKTAMYAPWLTSTAMDCHDNEATLFIIGPTLEHARALLWRPLENLNARYNLGLQLRLDPARCYFPSGAVLYFRGAKDKEQLGVLRGFKTLLVCVDEAQEIRDDILKEIETACGPGLRDLNGQMVFSGTPGKVPVGVWYDITTGARPNWSIHQWSLFDNPYLSESARDINLIMEEEGLTPEDPRFKREYLGLWVEDGDEMVYRWDLERNGLPAEAPVLDPSLKWHYVIGVDFGWSDDSAVVVGAFSFDSDVYYEVDEFKAPNLTLSDLMTKHVLPRIDKYQPMRVVGDAASRQSIEEINQRWATGMQKADKQGKLAYIEIMNSDFLLGRIKTPLHFGLVLERQRLVWDPSAKPKLIEHARRPNHLCDAALYAYREAKHWIGRDIKVKRVFGSEAEHEAYLLKQYIKGLGSSAEKPAADWANDDDFR